MDHDDLANYIRRQVQGRKVTSATIKGIVAKHGATRTSEIPVAELADVKAEIDAAGADPAEAERVKADHVQRMGGRKATTKEEDIAAAAAAEPERLKRLAEHLEKYPRPMTDFIAAGELIREQFALATKADKIIATLKTRIKDTRDKMIPLAAAQGASARVKAGKLLLKLRADFDAWLVECATVGRAPFPGNLKANTWPEFVAHYAERSERDCRRCMALARAADPEAAAEAEKKKNARASQASRDRKRTDAAPASPGTSPGDTASALGDLKLGKPSGAPPVAKSADDAVTGHAASNATDGAAGASVKPLDAIDAASLAVVNGTLTRDVAEKAIRAIADALGATCKDSVSDRGPFDGKAESRVRYSIGWHVTLPDAMRLPLASVSAEPQA